MDKKFSTKAMGQKVLPIFIFIILFFTIVSRILDSITIPKVKIEYLQQNSISYEVLGSGSIVAGEVTSISAEQGLIIRKIDCYVGKNVKQGDILFSYQMKELKKRYNTVERETEKLKLSLQVEIENGSELSKKSSAELANLKLEKAETMLAKAQEQYQKNMEEYNNKLATLSDAYEKDKQKTISEQIDEKYNELLTAERNYELAQIEEENAVNQAKWELDEAQRNLNNAGSIEDEDEDAAVDLDELSKKVRNARQALSLTNDKYNLLTEEAYQDKEIKQKAYDDLKEGTEDVTKDLQKEFEANTEEIKDKQETAKEKLESAINDYEEALQSLSEAQDTDYNETEENNQKSKISQLEQKSIQLSIAEKNDELIMISNLIEDDGQVRASCDGVIIKADITLGGVAAGTEIVQTGYGDLYLKATISNEDAALINMGDTLMLSQNNNYLNNTDCILQSAISKTEEDKVEIMANIKSTELNIGEKADFKIISSSGKYDKVVPTNAIRKDQDSDYVLVVQDKSTILGTQQIALRIPVKILERNTSYAAVDGNLLKEHKIITEEGRNIKEGDRIRVVSK